MDKNNKKLLDFRKVDQGRRRENLDSKAGMSCQANRFVLWIWPFLDGFLLPSRCPLSDWILLLFVFSVFFPRVPTFFI